MFLEDTFRDATLAVREMRRRPAFTAAAAATLGLGIGSMAAVFGMAQQLVLRPLPGVPNTQAAAYMELASPETSPGNGRSVSRSVIDDLRRGASLLDGLAAYGNVFPIAQREDGTPFGLSGNVVYGDFFEVLGTTPAHGRLLTAEDSHPAANPYVVVISERRWRLSAAGDSGVWPHPRDRVR
jgi:hypothetical protein